MCAATSQQAQYVGPMLIQSRRRRWTDIGSTWGQRISPAGLAVWDIQIKFVRPASRKLLFVIKIQRATN